MRLTRRQRQLDSKYPSNLQKKSHIVLIHLLKKWKNEMGWSCGAYVGGERLVKGFGGETGGKETNGETQTQMGDINVHIAV